MSLGLDDLLAGPKLPAKSKYIDALEDTVEIQPVPLERYREYKDLDDVDGGEIDQQKIIQICIAESLSAQSEQMTYEEALDLNKRVQAKIHPAAWDEIAAAVMETMFGSARVTAAGQAAGNE